MTFFLASIYRNKVVWVLGLLFSTFLISLYIIQINSLTALAYHTSQAEQELLQTRQANTSLQQRTTRTMSFGDLEQLAQSRNFERVTSITYLRVVSGGVAQNQ